MFHLLSSYILKIKKYYNPYGIILIYHRVNDLDIDPQLLAVSRKTFSEQMAVLRESFNPVSIEEMMSSLQKRDLKKNSIAVTFDDGYEDNLSNALPILEKYQIPATFFLSIDNLINQKKFWWDELELIFLSPNKLPKKLEININNETYAWNLGDCSVFNNTDWNKTKNWNVTSEKLPTIRHIIYFKLVKLLREQHLTARTRLVEEIRLWSGLDHLKSNNHCLLDINGIKGLSHSSYAEIGAHTCNHPLLSRLDEHEQKQEIDEGRKKIKKIIDKEVTSFAYPYGYRGSYTSSTKSIVNKSGFKYACANDHGLVFYSTSRYALPRIICRDWNGDVFKEYLMGIIEPVKI